MKMLILTVAFLTGTLVEQSYSQPITSWGEKVLGAQLSIVMTNSVLSAGASTTIQCCIKNSSTNLISLTSPLMLLDDTHLFLINNLGTASELTPKQVFGSIIGGPTIKAGETYQWDKPWEISTNIEAGTYRLQATRYIHTVNGTNYQGGKLVSNLLEVQIK
jgi:hypothetical protein